MKTLSKTTPQSSVLWANSRINNLPIKRQKVRRALTLNRRALLEAISRHHSITEQKANLTWNTVRMAAGKVSKLVVGVSSSKLNLERNRVKQWSATLLKRLLTFGHGIRNIPKTWGKTCWYFLPDKKKPTHFYIFIKKKNQWVTQSHFVEKPGFIISCET